jgi:capsular exopolysaccharide synthesis family protein
MASQSETAELELRDYVRVLSRRKWMIVLAALVVLVTALGASLAQTPVYQARALLLLQPRATDSLFNPNTGQANDPARTVQTEIEILTSEPVKSAVRQQLGAAPDISASPVGQTDVIQVRSNSTRPKQAAAVANSYARAYIDFKRKQAVDDLLAAGAEIQSKIGTLQAQIDPLQAQINSADPKNRADVESRLSPQLDPLLSQYSLFKQKLDQLQVDAALKTGGAQLVTPASEPTSPIKPRPKRTAVFALAVGLLFGVGIAFLFDHLDDSIKTKDDLERLLPSLPILGLIPVVPNWRDRKESRLASRDDPSSAAAEAYRSLRTSIQFLSLASPVKIVQLTSANAAEGKTTTLANLAVALARAGQRVIVCCCDLRRPRLHEFFGLSNGVGFTSVLLGEVPLSAALQRVPGEDNLLLLASGPLPPDPSELLASERAAELIDSLRRQADVILVDTPPVLPVTDAAVLSARADATLIVVTPNVTTRKQISRAVEVLTQVDAPVVGTVLNGVAPEHGYGYSYRYYREDERPAQTGRRSAPRPAASPMVGEHMRENGGGNGNGAVPDQPEAGRRA